MPDGYHGRGAFLCKVYAHSFRVVTIKKRGRADGGQMDDQKVVQVFFCAMF